MKFPLESDSVPYACTIEPFGFAALARRPHPHLRPAVLPGRSSKPISRDGEFMRQLQQGEHVGIARLFEGFLRNLGDRVFGLSIRPFAPIARAPGFETPVGGRRADGQARLGTALTWLDSSSRKVRS
jgi:hypothetical protein